MLHDRLAQLQAMFGPGLAQRATLLVNHVLSREPAALSRLSLHCGRRFKLIFTGAPAWWPAPAPLHFEISRAGLLDADRASESRADGTDVVLTLDVSDPLACTAALFAGDRSKLRVEGDSAFADDLRWLIDNLRWDVEDDLEHVVGPAAAHGIARAGAGVAAVARDALAALASLRGHRP